MMCKELIELVTDYLEGSLSDADRARFDAHLRECPPCEDYLEQMRVTLQALGTVPAETISPEGRRRLLETFRNWKSEP